MPWASTAISAGLSIGGSIFGGNSKKKAAKKAAKAQAAAAARQEAMVREFDARTQKQTEPYRQFGEGATSKLSDYLGIDSVNPERGRAQSDYDNAQAEYSRLLKTIPPSTSSAIDPRYVNDFGVNGAFARLYGKNQTTSNANNDALLANAKARLDASRAKLDGMPANNARSSNFGSLLKSFSKNDLNNDVVYNNGLQFGLEQGNNAINNRALATGNFDSGAALKELTRYANDYGETKAEGAQNRFMGDKAFTFNALSGGVGVGQNAVNTASGNSSTALNSMNSAIAGGGNARSAGAIARGNADGEIFGSVTNALGGINFGDLFKRNNTVSGNASPGIQLRRF